MSQVYEIHGRQAAGGDGDGRTRQFFAESYSSEALAIAAVQLAAPGTLDGYARTKISVDEISNRDDDYLATVQYTRREGEQDTGSIEYRFSYAAKAAHITQSLETVQAYGAIGQPPDFGGAINVTSDRGRMKVEGVNLATPPETFSYTYYPPKNVAISRYYQYLVNTLTGKVNSAPWNGYKAGELMLVRANGGARNNEDWSIEFGFSYIQNQSRIPVGDMEVSKRGHDLLWVYYDEIQDPVTGFIAKPPLFAYVERVHHYKNFAVLGF